MTVSDAKPASQPKSSRVKKRSIAGSHGVLKESGCDWLSVTCNHPELRWRFREMAVALLHLEGQNGNDCKPWSFMGFTGLKCGGIGYGEMDQMDYMRLSGPTAYSYWMQALPLSTNCSRFDVQVTVSGIAEPDEAIVKHYADTVKHYATWLRPPTVDLRLSNRTGNTMYLNTRSSARFGRIYNKHTESRSEYYRGCLRYEVQFNGKLAKIVSNRILEDRDFQSGYSSRVLGFFEKAQVAIPCIMVDSRNCTVPRRRSDVLRRLRWLDVSVRPCVQNLIEKGHAEAVLSALGLTDDILDQLVQFKKER